MNRFPEELWVVSPCTSSNGTMSNTFQHMTLRLPEAVVILCWNVVTTAGQNDNSLTLTEKKKELWLLSFSLNKLTN